mmetsp:Transcript_32116/g.44526  ORF Transcript_32116/g.44526 Transcript_32116/m.44526 type:complete len:103 (-) Transcript_32116:202-510(-)|eukprot:CAMPEP_0196581802 /NCGR_PEP_ID=MMETSP1081-20130531/35667_1 /TAXON_ID=36882 /ORGANISM="Pyramimonas amylifera, Strain CCMP720" /LENGTH=102 /DNA_ID=CAMNT_0041902161 /DNA_START=73 /DNA_END=381 /DNA_ORIENTATION=+
MVREVKTEEEWDQIKGSEKPVLVDFTATWCGPCKAIAPFFAELEGKYPSITFVKVDVDELDGVAAVAGVSAMPTFQVWQNGAKVSELIGASKEKLEDLAKSL